jgi:hypothetical protein
MMKNFLFLFSMLLLLSTSRAQNEPTVYKHSVGLSGAISSRIGFSYRYWPKTIGVQVTGIPIFSSDHFLSSSGLTVLFKIRDFSNIRLYGFVRNNMNYQEFSYFEGGGQIESKLFIFNSDVGAGIKLNFLEIFDLNVQTGYGVNFYPKSQSIQTRLAGEIGLYYHF